MLFDHELKSLLRQEKKIKITIISCILIRYMTVRKFRAVWGPLPPTSLFKDFMQPHTHFDFLYIDTIVVKLDTCGKVDGPPHTVQKFVTWISREARVKKAQLISGLQKGRLTLHRGAKQFIIEERKKNGMTAEEDDVTFRLVLGKYAQIQVFEHNWFFTFKVSHLLTVGDLIEVTELVLEEPDLPLPEDREARSRPRT